MDPLSKHCGSYKVSNNQNAIIDAFEAAASSFAVNHKIPGSKYYVPSESSKEEQKETVPKEPIHNEENNKVKEEFKKRESNATIQSSNNHNASAGVEMPVPSNMVIYPPPMPDDSDPDRTRLLHSWYWAGYYTGLADGKRFSNV